MLIKSYNDALKVALSLEFSKPENFLHFNKNEKGFTVGGIYQAANPNWNGWNIVNFHLQNSKTLEEASIKCYNDKNLWNLIARLYKTKYWDSINLDTISISKAAEIFIFGINAGPRTAIRELQRYLGVQQDGILGRITRARLETISDTDFDKIFDEIEINYYQRLIIRNPKLRIYRNGWINRAKMV